MDNTAATGLPGVDSLPDGFVDSSSTEPLCPPTPTFEQEKPLIECSPSSVSDRNESILEVLSATESRTISQSRTENTQKPRNFPVPLSQVEGGESLNASLGFVTEDDKDYKDHCFGAATSAAPEFIELHSDISGGKLKDGKLQSPEQPSEGSTSILHMKEIPLAEDDLVKNKKLEPSETKRKNAKRSFISEKEFLEFTLKYQQVVAERDTAASVRNKLESLCRELQRQNKMLMDECKRVSTEGQNLRLDLSNKFQDAIKDVSIKLDQQKDECLSTLKENETLKVKLKAIADQYVLAEQHHEQELKQKNLELQIAELRIKQHEEKMVHEQTQMKSYAEQVSQLLATEKNLRVQLTADGEKFQQFQDALLKSNEVFETFKQEIEKMAKSIKDLKKENTFLKGKCEKTDFTLIQLVEDRERMKMQIEKLKNQKEKLESLCRTLQAERRTSSSTSDSAAVV